MNPILVQFYNRLKESPNQCVLYSEQEKYSFVDLDNFSNNIANKLEPCHKKYVPFYVKNDIFLLPIILGILKVNKIPVPLNTTLDLYRAKEQIEDLSYSIIISDTFESRVKPNLLVINTFILTPEKLTFDISSINEISYCIMTSGTTGMLKKILLSGENIDNILKEYYNIIGLSSESRTLLLTPATFDVSLSEILAPIFTGSKLVCFGNMATDINRKIRHTIEYIKQNSITSVFFAPAYADVVFSMGNKDDFKSLLTVSIAGEQFPQSLKNIMADKLDVNYTRVFNLYGPAETTLFATYYQLSFKEINYKTGDYVRIDQEGNFVFKCRKDFQIKLNGVRIELDSIDVKLLSFF